VVLAVGGVLLLAFLINLAVPSEGKNQEFQPQNESKLDPWLQLKVGSVDLSINKAVLSL
jgi:hypothetical protein